MSNEGFTEQEKPKKVANGQKERAMRYLQQMQEREYVDDTLGRIAQRCLDNHLPPQMAALSLGVPLPQFKMLVQMGENSAFISSTVRAWEEGLIPEAVRDRLLVGRGTNIDDYKEHLHEGLERGWKDIQEAVAHTVQGVLGAASQNPKASESGAMLKAVLSSYSSLFAEGDEVVGSLLSAGDEDSQIDEKLTDTMQRFTEMIQDTQEDATPTPEEAAEALGVKVKKPKDESEDGENVDD